MQTRSWASAAAALLALAAACGGGAERTAQDTTAQDTTSQAAASSELPTVEARTAGGVTRLDIRTAAGAQHTLTVTRDSTVAPTAEPAAPPMVLVSIGDSVVILIDAYPSIPGGMSFCQAGQEHFLRVIALTGAAARESYQAKLGSCRAEIELADEGLTWRPDSALVRLHWLTGPAGTAEVRTLYIAADGAVRVTKEE